MKHSNSKWRFRYYLRTLFVLAAIVAAVSASAGRRIHEAREQTDALATLPLDEVEYEPKDNWQGRVRQIVPETIAGYLGEPFFSEVVGIELRPSSDEDLRQCLHFPHLERAFIHGLTDGVNAVSAEGMRQLQALPKLRELELFFDALNSAQLEAITNIATLESLAVRIADGNTSLTSFALMRQLKYLWLFLDSPSDLGNLRLPPNLEHLILSIDRLDGEAFSQIFGRLDLLQVLALNVHDSHIDKLTVGAIARLTNLRSLAVTSVDLLDADLSELATLTKLESLSVLITSSAVTSHKIARFRAAVQALKETMPTLKKVVGPSGAVFEFR